jgi:hypothetical protein
MSLVFNTKTYSADSFGANQVGFIGPAKSGSVKDDLVLRRTGAKPVTNFSGVNRSNLKLTRTQTLTNALTPSHDAIMDIVSSLPVGMSDASVDAMCDDVAALIGSASFKTHLKTLKVNF